MVILDGCECKATYFMSRSIKILRQKFPQVKLLVSYADQTEGHTGTVYKAGSWKYHGKTGKKYHYMKNGIRVNKRIPWDAAKKKGMTEGAYVKMFGYEKITEEPKLRFIKEIRR